MLKKRNANRWFWNPRTPMRGIISMAAWLIQPGPTKNRFMVAAQTSTIQSFKGKDTLVLFNMATKVNPKRGTK